MSKADNVTSIEGAVNDTPMTPEEVREEMLINERDILSSLMGKDDEKKEADTLRIDVRRPSDKKTLFSFRIRALEEHEYNRCREKHTKYKKNGRFGGIKIPEQTNTVMYHSELIYTATIEEDRKLLWDNKKFWDAANVITGVDMVEKLIPYAGVKQRIVEKIEELSGYSDDDDDDDIKN